MMTLMIANSWTMYAKVAAQMAWMAAIAHYAVKMVVGIPQVQRIVIFAHMTANVLNCNVIGNRFENPDLLETP